MGFVIGAWSPAVVCCRERELCGFVHGDDFIVTGDSMQLAWIESRLNEGLILQKARDSRPGRWGRQDGHDPEPIGDFSVLHFFSFLSLYHFSQFFSFFSFTFFFFFLSFFVFLNFFVFLLIFFHFSPSPPPLPSPSPLPHP